MNATTEKRLEDLLWIANQTMTPAVRESIGTEYYEEMSALKRMISVSWQRMADRCKPQIEK